MSAFSNIQDFLSVTRDILGILSTAILTVIAVLGLYTWKSQLKGKTEYELARRLLRAVFRTRDAIILVRHIYASPSEIAAALQEAGIEIDQRNPDFHSQSQDVLYRRRWKAIQEALAELDIEAFEAEVIWGTEARTVLLPLRQQIGKLRTHLELYLRSLRASPGQAQVFNMDKVDEVIFDSHDLTDTDSVNAFTVDTAEAIKRIENYLRLKIKL